MIKTTKKIQGHIKSLLILGTLFLSGGVIFMLVVLNAKQPEDWLLYYSYFKAIGAVLGLLYVNYWNAGGRVTINFDKSNYTEDEKVLDNLIIKYRSNILMILPPILYVLADFTIGSIRTQPYMGSFEGYFTSVLIGFFVTLLLSSGVKYLSAWWNIKRNWKKLFD